MKNTSISLGTLIILGSLSMVGCVPDREAAYRDTQITELERVNKELENQLQACIDNKTKVWIDQNPGATPIEVGKGTIRDVTIGTRPMETVITIESKILFKPGSADISTSAKTTLLQVVALLKNKYASGFYVRVDGHTDNQKVSRSHDKWDDNWDLSGGRGQAVLHFLIEHGIPAHELGFAGFGEERPVGPNSSENSRLHNRRVEIVVIPNSGERDSAPEETAPPVHRSKKTKTEE